MIIEVSKSHLKVQIGWRVVNVPVGIFFPPNDDKVGFSISKNEIKYWDTPHDSQALTGDEIRTVIEVIRQEVEQAGHMLVVEQVQNN